MRRLPLLFLCATCALMLSTGCGGGDDPVPDSGTPYVPPIPDAGTPDSGVPDSGTVDLFPPSVSSHTPPNNAIAVPPESVITVTFNEPMRADRGTLQISPGNTLIQVRPEFWNTARTTVTFTFAQGLPLKTKLTLNVVDFADAAGNPLPAPFTFTFTVSDGLPPRVAEAAPIEGASQVPLSTAQVSLTFNEPMDTSVGTLTPGGGLTLGTPTWSADKQTLTAPISGLVNNGVYSVRLQGFRNLIGKAFDETTYLGDGKLDFGTGPDVTPPTVAETSPAPGEQNVPADSTSLIYVAFSEPMSPVGTATLVDNGNTPLAATWSSDGFIATFDVLDRLRPGATLRVQFAGFKDRAGNAFNPNVYLTSGAITFATATDRTRPYVVSSNPAEGAQEVYAFELYVKPGSPPTVGQRKVITFQFSEPMNTAFMDGTLYSTGDGTIPPRTLTGQWSTNRRTLTFTLNPPPTGGPPLEQFRQYSLDLSTLRDPSGNLLDTMHPVLQDGRLDFKTLPNDVDLNQACEDVLLKTNLISVTATSTITGATPRTDVLRERYSVTLPASGTQFQGFTKFIPSTHAEYSLFLSTSVLTTMTDATGESAIVRQGNAPDACPNHIRYYVDFAARSYPELRMRFGPSAESQFQLLLLGTL
ncbi:Ig-like domain-containing protein [Hyalangium rubrum]|uniref:Ig-like domain-containing protein n=1 Tax=Hyalangium rubrum TaxID=3103134 RepID=A0ABU5GXB0_9BACT|nr:Ig-like domain-containing protein [Hyalangium sp. s54d21]MDY7225517.1 Ig-like domain-containing protein [Hyalangium sp. s54d21]